MSGSARLDSRISAQYSDLSGRLKQAADYVVAHPFDIATRSLRSVAAESRIAPASFSRLARALGYDGFADLRGDIRTAMNHRVNSQTHRAAQLSNLQSTPQRDFMADHMDACVGNIRSLQARMDPQIMADTVSRLHAARTVKVFGAPGSSGISEQLTYMASLLFDNWQFAGHMGASLGAEIAALTDQDALIVITKRPFAPRSVRAAELARQKGTFVVVITDTHTCPALQHASAQFIIPSDSPNFFSSYTASLFFAETLIGMLAGIGGEASQARIAEVESNNRRLFEVIDG
ncbi:MurR/RpiR family transcriptional regulator [uncultured Roseobacter sp.]|uniref:MurR/RpiR family transcriptional regulator n=1 Tax=uncultured Roseobacter sp. TaxID=114847 RepID=UPI002617844C|nr:MurR/RpiR family transcriptional regulator [uncultured Roseobacter sp.]